MYYDCENKKMHNKEIIKAEWLREVERHKGIRLKKNYIVKLRNGTRIKVDGYHSQSKTVFLFESSKKHILRLRNEGYHVVTHFMFPLLKRKQKFTPTLPEAKLIKLHQHTKEQT